MTNIFLELLIVYLVPCKIVKYFDRHNRDLNY